MNTEAGHGLLFSWARSLGTEPQDEAHALRRCIRSLVDDIQESKGNGLDVDESWSQASIGKMTARLVEIES